MRVLNTEHRWAGNSLTLDELAEIELNAERSKTAEAATILRLAAALREAMQVSEAALACMKGARNPNHLRPSEDHGRSLSRVFRRLNSFDKRPQSLTEVRDGTAGPPK